MLDDRLVEIGGKDGAEVAKGVRVYVDQRSIAFVDIAIGPQEVHDALLARTIGREQPLVDAQPEGRLHLFKKKKEKRKKFC